MMLPAPRSEGKPPDEFSHAHTADVLAGSWSRFMENFDIAIAAEAAQHNPKTVYLSGHERAGNLLVLGHSPEHKPNLLWNMAVADIEAGAGVIVLDVTGAYARPLLDALPSQHAHRTWLFDPSYGRCAMGFNPLRGVSETDRRLVAQDVMQPFKAVWGLGLKQTPLLFKNLRFAIQAILDYPDTSLLLLYPFLTDAGFRQRVLHHCTDPIVRLFWEKFSQTPEREQREKLESTLTRVEMLFVDPVLRNVLGQIKGRVDLDSIVYKSNVLVADLDSARLGSETSTLFASLIIARLQCAIRHNRHTKPVFLYLPDGPQIHPEMVGNLLQAALPGTGVITSFPNVASYETEVRTKLLAAGSVVAFSLVPDDLRHVQANFPVAQVAETLPTLHPNELVLSGHPYVLKALVRSGKRHNQRRQIERRSRDTFAVMRKKIEGKIDKFFAGLE